MTTTLLSPPVAPPTIDRPIFRSAAQAIYFAYMLHGLPVRRTSGLARAIQKALEELGEVDTQREVGTVNFSGLDDLEVRGQCSMIRLRVETMLDRPASWALQAKFGLTLIRYVDGQRYLSFSTARTAAMRALTANLTANFDGLNQTALMLIIARVCGDNDAMRPTFRDIEKASSVSRSTLERREKEVSKAIFKLLARGLDTLEPEWRRDGLIGNPHVEATN